MSPLSRLSTTREHQTSRGASGVEVRLSSEVVGGAAQLSEVEEVHSSGLVAVADNKEDIMTTAEVEAEEVAVGLAGRTMTSPSEIGSPQLSSNPTGRWRRKLTSIVYTSSIWILEVGRISTHMASCTTTTAHTINRPSRTPNAN